jgi:hypothetical protein
MTHLPGILPGGQSPWRALMNDRCIAVTPEIVREARTPGTVLNQLIDEYTKELTKRGVPEKWHLSADELLHEVLAISERDEFFQEMGESYDYEALEGYLTGFLDRWEEVSRA